jgi:hypothetical protein
MNWIEQKAKREQLIRGRYMGIWVELLDAISATVDSYQIHFPDRARNLKVNRNDHAGRLEISGEILARSMRLDASGSLPRIGIYEGDMPKPETYLDFGSDGTEVWIVAGEKKLTTDEASRAFSEDVLF